MAHHVVTQTSLLEENVTDYKKQVEDLRKQKQTLEGKISGYHFLGQRLKERDEEYKKLLQEKKDLEDKLNRQHTPKYDPPVAPTAPVQTDEKDIQTSFLSGYNLSQINQPKHIPLMMSNQMQTSVNKSSVKSTDLFATGTKGLVQATVNGNNTILPQDGPKRPHEHKLSAKAMAAPINGSTVNADDLFLSGPKREIYEPPSQVMFPPPMNQTDPMNMEKFDVTFSKSSSNLDRRPIINGHVSPETIHKLPVANPKNTVKKNLYAEESQSPPGSFDLMMFSSDQVRYPPTTYKTNLQPETNMSFQLVSQTAKDLSLDGPPGDIKKYLEETLLPELDKQDQIYKQQKKMVEVLKVENSKLREENQRLKLVTQNSNISPSGSLVSQNHEWDYVKRSEALQAPLLGSDQSNVLLTTLEHQNKRLSEANKQWQDFFQSNEKKIEEYDSKILKLQQEIETLKTNDEQKRADFERILFETKQQQSDEEMAKEDAQGQLAEMTGKCNKLQADLLDLTSKLEQTTQEKNLLQIHLDTQRNERRSGSYQGTVTVEEMKSEIEALRQQLTLFQEDFDRERRDRAQAQSQKDQVQTQLEAVKRELKAAQNNNKGVTRQLQSAETNVRQTMMYNHQLRQEVQALKNQLKAEREANTRTPYQPVGGNQNVVGGGRYFNPQNQFTYTAQPQAEPYAEPVPEYMVQQQPQWNRQNDPNGMTGVFHNNAQVRNRTLDLWSCPQCTLNNDPTRTVCEMCGFNRAAVNTGHGNPTQRNNSSSDLIPRGDAQNMPDNHGQNGDLAIDTGHPAQT